MLSRLCVVGSPVLSEALWCRRPCGITGSSIVSEAQRCRMNCGVGGQVVRREIMTENVAAFYLRS